MKSLLIAAILSLCSSYAQASQGQCLDVFRKSQASLTDFSEIDFQHFEDKPAAHGRSQKRGVVTLTGLHRDTRAWSTIGSLEYKIQGPSLTVTRLIETPEYYGQGVYTRMIESVLQKNLNIDSVTISLTGPFFQKYREDMQVLGDAKSAVEANPVYAQFESLGFKNITYLFELSNTQQVYLRLTLSRPFQ